ncbi:SAM-dependent methyltransferase [Micromonospora sp. NPDC048898]|uniref:SAM-dependent methyltransferase n=1 Tax=Micromonospora sp. NPDC048898 TaxID=3364260 RepID=UPI003717EDF9
MVSDETGQKSSSAGGRATVARMYDYLLGGKHNFPADRAAAQELQRVVPESADIALSNRQFLGRVVQVLAERGIRQFIDLGSGIPTQGNVHQIVQRVDPTARVLYVDIDPVAIVASNEILADNPYCRAVEGDFTRPDSVLDALAEGDLATLFDLDQPAALLYFAVLQQVSPSQVEAVVAPLRDRLVPGSAIAISHLSHVVVDTHGEDSVEVAKEVYRRRADIEITLRSPEEIASLFGGFSLLEPGLARLPEWRPLGDGSDPYASAPEKSPMVGGVGIRA